MRSAWLVASLLACTSRGATLPPEDATTRRDSSLSQGIQEGVAFDARGAGFISVGRNAADTHAVYQLGPNSEPTLWIRLRIPNGHKVLPDGTHIVAADGVVLHLAPDGALLDSLTTIPWSRPPPPNDIALDGHGGFFFTDTGEKPVAGTLKRKVSMRSRASHSAGEESSLLLQTDRSVPPTAHLSSL